MTTEYQLAEVGVTADQLLPCECGPYGSHAPDDLRPATMPKRVRPMTVSDEDRDRIVDAIDNAKNDPPEWMADFLYDNILERYDESKWIAKWIVNDPRVRVALAATPVPPVVPEGWQLVSIDSHYKAYPYAAFIVEEGGMPDDAVMGTGDTWQEAIRSASKGVT